MLNLKNMHKISKNEQGFGLIEILLIILIVAVIGFGGYYVWHTQHQTSPAATATTTTTKSTSAQQYLTIQAWGVRVPMPSDVDVSDIYYVMETDTQNGNSPEAALASHKLSALTADCVPQSGVNESPFGYIERMTPAAYQQAVSDSEDTGVTGGTLLGSYYFVWLTPVANCYENEAGNSQFSAGLDQITDNNTKPVDNFPQNMTTILKSITIIPHPQE
jgi:hypothetical protein